MDLNFKKDKDQNKMYLFFNCDTCGFHELVIEKYWIKGDIDNFILCIKEVHPSYERVIKTVGDGFKTDGVLCTEYICGKCKSVGNMLPVPGFALNMLGYETPGRKIDKESKNQNRLLENIKSLFSKNKDKDGSSNDSD